MYDVFLYKMAVLPRNQCFFVQNDGSARSQQSMSSVRLGSMGPDRVRLRPCGAQSGPHQASLGQCGPKPTKPDLVGRFGPKR